MSSCTQGANGQQTCPMPSPSKNAVAIGIGTGIAILGALLLLILLIVWQSKRKRNADAMAVVDDLEDRVEMAVEASNGPAWQYAYPNDVKPSQSNAAEKGGQPQAITSSPAVEQDSHNVQQLSNSSANDAANDNKERLSATPTADDTEELIGVPVLLSTNEDTAALHSSSEQHSINGQSSVSASNRTSHDSRPREQPST